MVISTEFKSRPCQQCYSVIDAIVWGIAARKPILGHSAVDAKVEGIAARDEGVEYKDPAAHVLIVQERKQAENIQLFVCCLL